MSTVTSLVLSGKRKIIKQRPFAYEEATSVRKETEAQLRSASTNNAPAAQAKSQQQGK
jgi:hypothetical protein